MTVEVVGLLVPSIAMCVLLLVFAYRLTTTGQALTATSAAAARAASLQPDAAAALAAARSAATTDLTRPGHPRCTDGLVVALDAERFRPGGLAVVTITCTLSAQQVARLAVPGHLTRSVTSQAPIGQYRALTNTRTSTNTSTEAQR